MRRFLSGSFTLRTVLLIANEHLLVVASVVVAALLRSDAATAYQTAYQHALNWSLVWRASFIALVLQVCLHYCDLYDLRNLRDRRIVVSALMQAVGAACVVLAVIYYWLPALIVGRGVFVIASLMI